MFYKTTQKALLNGEASLRDLPKRWRSDSELIKAAVRRNLYELEFASPSLRADASIIRLVLETHGTGLEYASAALQDNEELVRLSLERFVDYLPHQLKFASPRLRDNEEIVRHALRLPRTGTVLRYASDRIRWNEDFIRMTVSNDGNALEHAPPPQLRRIERSFLLL